MKGLEKSLKTNYESGLTPVDFDQRDEEFGSNKKPPPKRTPFIKLFIGALDDFMLKLLMVCAVVSIAIEVGFADPADRSHGKLYFIFLIKHFLAWIEGTAIFVAIFVVAFVGSWNDYQKEL